MRLTTLGTGTISLNPTRACAGHHVSHGGVELLMDCGAGVARRLAEIRLDWWSITHVAITHFHADHFADFPSLVFAWMYARRPGRVAPLEVIGPPGTAALLARLASAFGEWVTAPGFPLAIHEMGDGDTRELGGGVLLSCRKVPHTDESVAYSVEAGGRRVVYTGDTGYDPSLGEWASGCDVLLAECSLPPELAIPSHLTPEQCGMLAAIARPRTLALTHLYPPLEEIDVRAAVATRFGGDIVVATDGWTTVIEDMQCWS